jgi:predicted nucleic acid binding AN1-type Zn finger protein
MPCAGCARKSAVRLACTACGGAFCARCIHPDDHACTERARHAERARARLDARLEAERVCAPKAPPM